MTTNGKTQSAKPFLYPTTDIGLAAALMALGFELTGFDDKGQAVFFTFRASPMIFEAAKAYEEGTLTVNAKRMGEAMQVLDIALWDQRDLENV